MRAEGDALGRAEAVKGSNGAGRLLAGLRLPGARSRAPAAVPAARAAPLMGSCYFLSVCSSAVFNYPFLLHPAPLKNPNLFGLKPLWPIIPAGFCG